MTKIIMTKPGPSQTLICSITEVANFIHKRLVQTGILMMYGICTLRHWRSHLSIRGSEYCTTV